MKIAFWSGQEKAGTTFNTAVIACASVLLYPLTAAVVSGRYGNRDLERKFWQGKQDACTIPWEDKGQECPSEDLAAEQPGYYVERGLGCLMRKKRPHEMTRQLVKANMRQVVEGRMYCMPASRKADCAWGGQAGCLVRLRQAIAAVDRCFDVVFIDCGSKRDDLAKALLDEADLCVLNMAQGREQIGDYLRDFPGLRQKTFFLIGNYYRNGRYTRRDVERIYRIEEHMLGAIPYNPQMQAAADNGMAERGIRRFLGNGMRGKSVEFEQELTRAARLILKRAGAIE